jgi:hypothetical protein
MRHQSSCPDDPDMPRLQARVLRDERRCAICWDPIRHCSGFVLIGDAADGRIPRELCGRCDVFLFAKVVGRPLVMRMEDEDENRQRDEGVAG